MSGKRNQAENDAKLALPLAVLFFIVSAYILLQMQQK